MPLIISFISQKGGVGKSTLARSFSIYAKGEGLKVLLADLDYHQQTSVKWSRRRAEQNKKLIQPDVMAFPNSSKALDVSPDFQILVLDTKGYADKETSDICNQSDMVILPCGFSIDEREPTFVVLNTLTALGVDKSKLNVALLGDYTVAREREARKYFGAGGYHVLDGFIRKKVTFEKALDQGLALQEASNADYRQEANALMLAISNRLEVVV